MYLRKDACKKIKSNNNKPSDVNLACIVFEQSETHLNHFNINTIVYLFSKGPPHFSCIMI